MWPTIYTSRDLVPAFLSFHGPVSLVFILSLEAESACAAQIGLKFLTLCDVPASLSVTVAGRVQTQANQLLTQTTASTPSASRNNDNIIFLGITFY